MMSIEQDNTRSPDVADDSSATDSADDPRAVRFRERTAFVLGDIAANLTWSTISSYLLFFYTDVALIGAAAAGTLMLVARLLDALFDPAIGILMDRTYTRWGRARPYLLFGAPLVAALTVLTFLTPGGGGAPAIAYALVTFVLVGLAYSLVNVPYGAVMSLVTRSSETRMKLAGARTLGIGIGLIIVSTATQPLITLFGGAPNSRFGFAVTIGIYSVIAMVLLWTVFASVKERVVPVELEQKVRRVGIIRALKILIRNRPWASVFVFSILAFARLGVVTGGTVYYAIYVMHNPSAIPIVLLAFSLSAVAGAFITAPILNRLGHRRGILLGLIASVGLTLPLYYLQENLIAFTVVFFFLHLVGGFGFVAAPALTADTVELQEWRAGQRSEGLLFAGYSMSTKIGAALGSAALAWGLATVSYDPNAITPAMSDGIMWIYLMLPAGIAILQVIAISFYNLQNDLPAIKAAIALRRQKQQLREQ